MTNETNYSFNCFGHTHDPMMWERCPGCAAVKAELDARRNNGPASELTIITDDIIVSEHIPVIVPWPHATTGRKWVVKPLTRRQKFSQRIRNWWYNDMLYRLFPNVHDDCC